MTLRLLIGITGIWGLLLQAPEPGTVVQNDVHTDFQNDLQNGITMDIRTVAERDVESGIRGIRDIIRVDSIAAGDILIHVLPDSLAGRPVRAYSPVRIPATGWFHQQSLFWRTDSTHVGVHEFNFRAQLDEGSENVLVTVTVGESRDSW